MTVSLYDLLDVDQDATPDEIRAAWKTAIADLDPNDRRFRAYNDAAGVLLDDDKRAAYDAELAARSETETLVVPEPEPEREPEPTPGPDAEPLAEPRPEVASDAPATAEEGKSERSATSKVAPTAPTAGGPPLWSLYVAAGVAVVVLVLTVVVLSWPGSLGGTSPADREERSAAAEKTSINAAEGAVEAILSYDYRTFDEDVQAAEQYLTEDFAADRAGLLADLRKEVVREKVVVNSEVSGTGVTRVSEDGERAIVVVYVNQDSQHGDEAPQLLRMWATLTMVADGDDWLVDDICIQDCS